MYLTLEIRITELRFKNYRIRTNSVNFRAFCSMVVGGGGEPIQSYQVTNWCIMAVSNFELL